MSLNSGLDPEMEKKLEVLQLTPPRSPEKAALGRAVFLKEAQLFAGAVSKSKERRPNGWMQTIQSLFVIPKKEHSPMFSTIATILIAVSLVLGGGSLTVVGAQSSLPDQPLYSVKLLSEDARLRFTSSTDAALQLQLEFTDRRAAEIKTMLQNGQVPPETTQSRYQNQVEQSLILAAGMPDEKAVQALEQVRLHLQNQQQAFLQLNPNANPQALAALTRARQMLQQRLQWVEQGLSDPASLRERMRQMRQPGMNGGPANPFPMGSTALPGKSGMGSGNMMTTGTPAPGSGYGAGMGTGMGSNPWTTGTPIPGSGYGPGPGPMPSQTMGAGSGMGTGPGPMSTQTPGAGSGTGGGMMPTQQGPQPTSGMGGGIMPTQPGPQPTSGMGGGGMHR
ncbi:MAG: DUF5667 domain-containing protein [Methanothrix sp.]|nr:DUF5667 domain-containing protein [Methanothrix sp.]